jgi:transposase
MYSLDFRKLAVSLFHKYKNYRVVSGILSISTSTLHRWITTGVYKKLWTRRKTKLSMDLVNCIISFIQSNPFTTLLAISLHLETCLGVSRPSTKTISKYLRIIKMSRKKAFHTVLRDHDAIAEKLGPFKVSLQSYLQEGKAIYSTDECYFSEKVLPSYGYCKVGQRLRTTMKPKKWEKRSLILSVSNFGDIKYQIIDGSVRSNTFQTFVTQVLKPSPNDVIMMDNVSFHTKVAKDLYDTNFLFVPPYSPEYNPIENCFSVVKGRFRSLMATRSKETTIDQCIEQSLESLTPATILNTFQHALKLLKDK